MRSIIKFLRISFEIFMDVLISVKYFISVNLRYFATILGFALPYLMYAIGQRVALERGGFSIGSELLIPIVISIITYWVKSYANKIGKGHKIPVPNKRFTEVDDDGEVSVRNDRIQELLLYLADLEDWMERKGLI